MAMVGLFWIAEGDVYVGAKPSGTNLGVRLSHEGVVALGDGQSGFYPWQDVRALTVQSAPVKTVRRRIGAVVDLAMTGLTGWVDESPPLMALHVERPTGKDELWAYTAAVAGYSETELDLSRTLLARLTEGAATMSTTLAAMSEWGRSWEGGTPRETERERLLRAWLD
ncbi:hypothetical protein N4P33_04125 [Streptomyces sp. 15-116A]|uniref:hypothetical protein n=1 Tax=Streptomyces sp. 15-116A TaxID=2259035 RepID=UPI0021B3F2D8|nr:hypothetical protein [Streptomyces sp. 15-116A]MCT7351356.1 hypothetical protein [Streptomyces sp. 15-116A]